MSSKHPIVLAYSGGLDTSFCIPWLKEKYECQVFTVTVDTGGLTQEDQQKLSQKALKFGATKHVTLDAKSSFFEETLRFLIFGNVLKGNVYPLCVGAERALQARVSAKYALSIGASSIAHGSTAAGNDQVRFEVAYRTIAPELQILAPIRDEGFSREFEVSWLKERGFELPVAKAEYSVNSGLWGCTIGGKETTNTTQSIPEEAWILTRDAFLKDTLGTQSHILTFEQGIPVAWDHKRMDPVSLIAFLNEYAGKYGIGRGIHLGDTIFGLKGRVAFEAPAAKVLITAHRELEKLVMTSRQQKIKDQLSVQYGEMVHEALSLDPACRDIESLFINSQNKVTGQVYLEFRQGHLFVLGVDSPFSLKDASKSVYGEAALEWTAADAKGFSKMVSIPSVLYAKASQQNKGHSQ